MCASISVIQLRLQGPYIVCALQQDTSRFFTYSHLWSSSDYGILFLYGRIQLLAWNVRNNVPPFMTTSKDLSDHNLHRLLLLFPHVVIVPRLDTCSLKTNHLECNIDCAILSFSSPQYPMSLQDLTVTHHRCLSLFMILSRSPSIVTPSSELSVAS
jgi:hypothetical protein